jgi:hypothetical protein
MIDPLSSAPLMTTTGTTSRTQDSWRANFVIAGRTRALLPLRPRHVRILVNKQYRSTGLSLRGRKSAAQIQRERHTSTPPMRVPHGGDNPSTYQFGILCQCALEGCSKRCYCLSATGDQTGGANLAPALSPDPEQDLLKMGSDLELHLTSIAIAPTRNAKATTGNP